MNKYVERVKNNINNKIEMNVNKENTGFSKFLELHLVIVPITVADFLEYDLLWIQYI